MNWINACRTGPGDCGRNRGTFPVRWHEITDAAPGSGVIPSRKTKVVKPIRRGDARVRVNL